MSHATNDGSPASRLFSGKVADYLASRPDYPAALFDELAALGALAPGCEVADIGAGTGLLTAAMLARGHHVVAVEPNDEMRAACDALLGRMPGYRSSAGRAEASGLSGESVDLITAAQAFHWFDVAPARREALRVLRPRGQVALVWNDRDDADPLQQALGGFFAEHGGAARDAMLLHDDRAKVPMFFGHEPLRREFPHAHRLDLAGFQSLVFSRSYMPRRGTEAAARAEQALAALFDRFAEDDGRAVVRYRTVLMLGRPLEPTTA